MNGHLQTVIGLSAVATAGMGALIGGKTRNGTGWWLLAAGISLGVAVIALGRAGVAGAFFEEGTIPASLLARCAVPVARGREVLIVAGSAAWAASLATSIVFFPFGSLAPLRERRIGGRRLLAAPAFAWAGATTLVVAADVSPDRMGPLRLGLLRLGCPLDATAPAAAVGLLLLSAGCVVAVASALIRLRRVSGSDRAQLAPVAGTAAAAILAAAVAAVLQRWATPALGEPRWLTAAWVVAGLGIPAAVAVSIVRHRTFGIFRLVGLPADYWIWTGAWFVLLVAVAAGVTWAVTALTGLDRHPLAVAALALVIGAALLPVWRRRQAAVNARFGRRRQDPARTLEDLADATADQDPAPMRGPVFDLLRRFAPIVVVDGVEGMRFAVPTDDPEVGRHTFVHGAYDLDAMRAAISVLGGSLGGGTVLDVGANIGTSIVPLLTLFGAARGVAVEPEPRNLGLLRMNLDLNDLTGRVDVLAMGLSDHDGTMDLELSADNAGDHRMRVPGAPLDPDEETRQTLQVPVRRLDALMGSGRVDPATLSLVWLDVQGHEGHVLAGAGALMAGTVPIVTEFWPSVMDRNGGLARFMELVTQHVERIVDLRATQAGSPPVPMPAAKIHELAARYRDPPAFTDLLLLR